MQAFYDLYMYFELRIVLQNAHLSQTLQKICHPIGMDLQMLSEDML